MVIFHASALGVIMSPHSQRACATLLQTNHYAVGGRCGSATGSLRQYRGESSKSWRLINDLYHIAGMVELYVTLTGAGMTIVFVKASMRLSLASGLVALVTHSQRPVGWRVSRSRRRWTSWSKVRRGTHSHWRGRTALLRQSSTPH